MALTRGDKIKISILRVLSKENELISFYELMKKIKKSFASTMPHIVFLRNAELIEIKEYKNPKGTIYRHFKITKKGIDFIKTFEKNLSKD